MPRINLLPWREAQRKERQKDFLMALGLSVAVAAAVMGYVHVFIAGRIEFQQQRNGLLEREIVAVKKKIEEIKSLEKQRENLLARMDLIQRLQTSRPEVVHLFDEFPRLLPEGVYLTTIRQKDRNLTIEGVAQSNARISSFMRSIDSSQWLAEPKLEVIQTAQEGRERVSRFTLQAKQINPADAAKASPGAPGEPAKSGKPAAGQRASR